MLLFQWFEAYLWLYVSKWKFCFAFNFIFLSLGAHCEGPFINSQKKGAHDIKHIISDVSGGIDLIKEIYGSLENITIMTVAPELPGVLDCIPMLVAENIIVSIGKIIHSPG